MRAIRSLLRRFQSVMEKERSNVELGEELRFHVERETAENIARGMPCEQAEAAARASFGSVSRATEECYESRGVGWIEDLVSDLRYGLRTLRKERTFTLATVLTLALGIGACTAIFSVVNAVLLRSLPYEHPERLVYLFTPNPVWKLPAEVFGPSAADYFDLKKQSKSFADMTLFTQTTYNLAENGGVERVGAARVDGDFFGTLGAVAEVGRGLEDRDEQPGGEPVAVIGHGLWQRLLGGRADVVGSVVRLDGRPYRVVGVMPAEFGYPHKSDLDYGNGDVVTTDVWVPLSLTGEQKAEREISNGYAVARLKPGVNVREAQAEMGAIMSHLNLLHSADSRGSGEFVGFVKPFEASALGPARPLMWLLMGAVGFVLLIACGNAANLLLARAAARTHELGVRATLGARRGRLVRQMMTESLLLSAAAGVVGAGLAWVFLHALLRLNPGDIPRMGDARLDLRGMVFVVLVTVGTSLVFGVLPSLSATRINLAEFMKSSGMRGVSGDRRRVRRGLAVSQIALLVVLLTGTGLLLRSYANVLAAPTGFSLTTVTASVELSPQYGTAHERRAVFLRLMERLRSSPGVEAVGVVNQLPLSDSESLSTIWVEGYANEKQQIVEERGITPGYLAAMQTPLVEGRDFTEGDDSGHVAVAIVNEAFARRYFAGREAVGQRIRSGPGSPWVAVVGVAKDVRYEALETAAIPLMYRPFMQMESNESWIVSGYVAVRSTLPAATAVGEIREAVKGIDPTLAIGDVETMGELVSQVTARRRFQTVLLTVFSVAAMLLAMVGVYGLLAYSVRQRMGEIGIRMALGSSRSGVARLIVVEGLTMLGLGVGIGVAAALLCTRLMASFLYGVAAVDPVTFAVVPMALLLATLAACVIPSLRAAAVDPMTALRHE